MDATRPQAAIALSLGGLAALCSAPSLTSAVGGVGSLFQADVHLMLPGEQPNEPQCDMLLMHVNQMRSSRSMVAGQRRAVKRRSSSSSEAKSRSPETESRVAANGAQIESRKEKTRHGSTSRVAEGGHHIARRKTKKSGGAQSRVADGGHKRTKSRKRMTPTKTRHGSRKASGYGSKFQRRLRRKQQRKHKLQQRGKRDQGKPARAADERSTGDATGTLAVGDTKEVEVKVAPVPFPVLEWTKETVPKEYRDPSSADTSAEGSIEGESSIEGAPLSEVDSGGSNEDNVVTQQPDAVAVTVLEEKPMEKEPEVTCCGCFTVDGIVDAMAMEQLLREGHVE